MPIADNSIFHQGSRTGVLLIHGLGGTPVEMKSVARRIAETGATVYCCQLTGHCGTESDLVATRWQDWYASADEALAKLEENCDSVVVGGLSMGAILAARLAAQEPERVHGVIMFAPTLWYDGWSVPWYSFLLRWFIDTPMGRRYRFAEAEPYGVKDERIRRRVVDAIMSGSSVNAGLPATPALALREFWRLVDDVKPRLACVKQRVLIMQARDDDIASMANTEYLQEHLGGTVEALILDDSYHLITVDRQRRLVMQRAADFVRSFAQSAALEEEAKDIVKLRVLPPTRG
ncbi:MAG TPA: alpha/beta fold hydrolase [Xanthobacteraceae bacterium]|nr:alpha/beta fold hydrolase [Xanthobacteraceae bacterium]